MSGLEGFCSLQGQFQSLFDRNRAAADPAGQRFALHQFEDKEVRSVGFLRPADRRDVGAIGGSQQPGFTQETPARSASLMNPSGKTLIATSLPGFCDAVVRKAPADFGHATLLGEDLLAA